MRHVLTFGIVLVIVAFVAGSAFATDYYVAMNGDDGWPGTEAQPWATLDYAVDQISPGDTILIKSGTYDGCRIENSGLSGAVCTLKADTGASVLVRQTVPSLKKNSSGPGARSKTDASLRGSNSRPLRLALFFAASIICGVSMKTTA